MMFEHKGRRPTIDPSARVAPNATICGDVSIGPNVSVGFGAVITAESGPVAIGANCVIMDTAVLRGVRRNPLMIGANVLVGPRVYLTGCTVESEVFLATGATVFNGARIGRGAEVRVNAIVHLRTVLPAGATVPLGWIAVGARPKSCRRTSTSESGQFRRSSTFRTTCSESSVHRRANRSCRR